MSVLITMGHVPISVTIHKVVIIVSVPLDISFNLTITLVKVNMLLCVSFSDVQYYHYIECNILVNNDMKFLILIYRHMCVWK